MARQGGVVVTRAGSSPDIILLPATAGRLPVFTQSGVGAKLTDSIYAQSADERQVLIGRAAAPPVVDIAAIPFIAIGEGSGSFNAASLDGIAIGSIASAALRAVAIGKNARAWLADTIAIGSDALCNLGISAIAIGAGASVSGARSIVIGPSSASNNAASTIAIGDTVTQLQKWAVGIGFAVSLSAGGVSGVVIGDHALAGGFNNAVAIGTQAKGNNNNGIAIGTFAAVTGVAGISLGLNSSVAHASSIAIGNGAQSSKASECVIGGAIVGGGPITLVTVNPGAGVMVGHRVGGGGWGLRTLLDTATIFQVDESAVADNVRLLLWDVAAGVLKRVTRGVVDSGGVGFRLLRIVN